MPLIKTILKPIKTMKKIIVIALLIVANTLVAQQKLKVDGVAVVVGNNIVLDSDINVYKKQLESQNKQKVTISDCELLEQIMNRKLLADHAVIDSIEVPDAEINRQVDRKIAIFKQQLGSIDKVVKFYGFNNLEDFRKTFFQVEKEAALIQKMQDKITDKIDVTPEEVRRYYNSLKDNNNLPDFGADIELEQIVIKAVPSKKEIQHVIDRLNQIRKEVENGASFRMKTILYSDDPGVTTNSGEYTITRKSGFVKQFKEAAFSLDQGEISQPFKSEFGYHLLKVLKIKGKERVVRHLLIQPKVSDKILEKAKDSLQQIRYDIVLGKITFEKAVSKYSGDKETKNNNGLLVNPVTNDSHFDLTRMDPELYARVSNLKVGEITPVFNDETRSGEKMYKLIMLKSKRPSHKADLVKDYEKIQELALQKKKEEKIQKWIKDNIKDTYIKINGNYKKCKFKNNWSKN